MSRTIVVVMFAAAWLSGACVYCEETDNARVKAGLAAKLDGHLFEERLASRLSKLAGVAFVASGTAKKADLICKERDLRISLKNPTKGHTQIALIGQGSLAKTLALNADGRMFVRLFFGLSDGDPLEADELGVAGIVFDDLSVNSEVKRNRLLHASIPARYSDAFEKALNQDRKREFLHALVAGDSNVFGWAHEKNNLESVRFYRTQDILDRLEKAHWQVAASHSTFHLLDGKKKYMHIQMKGSSKRYSAGYHSAMIHVYDAVLDGLQTLDLSVKSGMLPAKAPDGADPEKVKRMELAFADVIDRTVFPELKIAEAGPGTAMKKLWKATTRGMGEYHPEGKVCGVHLMLHGLPGAAVTIDEKSLSLRKATHLICQTSPDLFYWLEYDPFKSSLLIGRHKDYLELVEPTSGDEPTREDHFGNPEEGTTEDPFLELESEKTKQPLP